LSADYRILSFLLLLKHALNWVDNPNLVDDTFNPVD